MLFYLDVGLLNGMVDDLEGQNVGCQRQSLWSGCSCQTLLLAIILDHDDDVVVETTFLLSHICVDGMDVFLIFCRIPNHAVDDDSW